MRNTDHLHLPYYILVNGEPVKPHSVLEWATWFETAERKLCVDTFTQSGETVRVSTVFLAIDHNFQQAGEPLLWETMIFGGPLDLFQWRYTSRELALKGHEYALKVARGEVKTDA